MPMDSIKCNKCANDNHEEFKWVKMRRRKVVADMFVVGAQRLEWTGIEQSPNLRQRELLIYR